MFVGRLFQLRTTRLVMYTHERLVAPCRALKWTLRRQKEKHSSETAGSYYFRLGDLAFPHKEYHPFSPCGK